MLYSKRLLFVFFLSFLFIFISFNVNFLAVLVKTVSHASLEPRAAKPSNLARDPDEKPTVEQEMSNKLDKDGRFFSERLIVKFKDGVSDDEKRNLVRKNKAKFIREDLNLLGAKVIWVSEADLENTYEALRQDPRVEYIEKEGVVSLNSEFVATDGASPNYLPPDCSSPNDSLYCDGKLWGLNSIMAPAGWNINKGSPAIAVAVLDTGVDYRHYDLNDRVVKGHNLTVSPSDFRYGDPMDDNGHGTFIAGIIGAETNNAVYMTGVDWNAKILAIKVLPSSGWGISPDIIAGGINEAANDHPELNVKVINLSFSFSYDSPTLRNAIVNAQNKGIVVVAAVAHPDDASTNCFVGFPAGYPGVISVSAIDQNSQHISGCTQKNLNGNSYQGVQLAAPGKDLYSLNMGGGSTFYGPGNTSFAAPYVSGVASIVASCSNSPVNDLLNGADNLGPSGYDSVYGYGKVNLWKALVQTCVPPGGDVNCDGKVTALDAMYILQYVAGFDYNWSAICPVFTSYADVDRDGDIDSVDALFALKIAAGIANAQTLALVPPYTDTDGDGMTDQQEAQYSCLNPNENDANLNPDNDSASAGGINVNMTNAAELAVGTNPCVADTDGDGFKDGVEIYVDTNPVKACVTDFENEIDWTNPSHPSKTWPADLKADGLTANKIDIQDIMTFISPIRRINTSPGNADFNRRWNVVLSSGGLGEYINVTDLLYLITFNPPMFGGSKAYGGPVCTP